MTILKLVQFWRMENKTCRHTVVLTALLFLLTTIRGTGVETTGKEHILSVLHLNLFLTFANLWVKIVGKVQVDTYITRKQENSVVFIF